MIPRSDLLDLPITEIKVGEQGRFNHTNCTAGMDTRGRLYVLHKDNNLWLAYCHNCGETGVLKSGVLMPDMRDIVHQLKDTIYKRDLVADRVVIEQTTAVVQMPDDANSGATWDEWAVSRMWQHHTTREIALGMPYAWSFSPSRNQIITPITNRFDCWIGYQARNAPGMTPKSITIYAEGQKGQPLFYNYARPDGRRILVIVEDPLSAMRIHNECSVYSCALLGTHLSDVAIQELLRLVDEHEIERILIWMDADSAGSSARLKIYKQLVNLFNPAKVSIGWVGGTEAKQLKDLKVS